MKKKNNRPKIYDYVDHLKYLNDMVEYFRTESKVFSFRYFAKKSGFASQSSLKFFLDGQRSLSQESVAKVCKGFGLDEHECDYFSNLVNFKQTTSNELKNKYFDEMRKMQKRKNVHVLTADHYEYFSKWYHPAVYELVRCRDFDPDGKWIARKISPMISVIEARESIKLLERLGLIAKDEKGVYHQTDKVITTEREIQSLNATNFHHEMGTRAIESLQGVSLERRHFNGITFAMSADKMQELKDMISEFVEKLSVNLSTYEDLNEVCHLNIQFFPLTKKEKK
jgi:uncharacterized protein (TIGR02147 family)